MRNCEEALQEARAALASDRVEAAAAILASLKAAREPIQGLDEVRGDLYLCKKDPYSAMEAYKEELRWFPNNKRAKELLQLVQNGLEAVPRPISGDEQFEKLHDLVRPYTMLSPERLLSLYELGKKACTEIGGNFVECGVAGGGSSALLASVLKTNSKDQESKLYSCDSFEGLPSPGDSDSHDGVSAESMGWGAGTCSAPVNSLLEICGKLGVVDKVTPVKGFFSDTLPKHQANFGRIAFLHMDGDWYSSTMDILTALYDQVARGGYIQIDDYGYWDGCRKAVEEFQNRRGLKFSLAPIDITGVWMKKQ